MSKRGLAFFVTTIAIASAVSSATPAAKTFRGTLLADDFEPRAVRVTRLDDQSLSYVEDKSEKVGTLPLARVIRLDAPAVTNAATSSRQSQQGFLFIFRDGQRWLGAPGTLKGDDLEWRPTAGAPKLVPLKSLAAVISMKADAASIAATATVPTADEVLLANGDVASGVVSASTATAVTLAATDGANADIDWANVRSLRFALTGAVAPAAPAPFRVSFADGRVIDAASVQLDDNGLRMVVATGDAPQQFDAAQIIGIEHRGGRARMLCNLAPAERTQSPYFPSTIKAPLAEPAAGNISIGGRAVRSSILARPLSVLRWSLDGTTKTFVTRYGIPDGRPLADCIVRVRLDGKVVHEQQHVKAGALSQLLKVPLGAAKSLTLEVDFGDTYDVQDDLRWVEPALLPD